MMKLPIASKAGPAAQENWTNRRFGRWTVLRAVGYVEKAPTSLIVWAKCECGYEGRVPTGNLISGRSRQCGECGKAAYAARRRAEKVQRLHADGRLVIGRKGHTYFLACIECGKPTRTELCKACRSVRQSEQNGGRPLKHPESLSVVAARFGVSKQRVQQVVAQHGWSGMLAYFAERKARVLL